MLLSILQFLQFTNVIVTTLPPRYDLPEWSCVNKEITRTNLKLIRFCAKFGNVTLIDINKYERNCFTRHGMHLNKRGKIMLASNINDALVNESSNKSVIVLGPPSQGN